MSGWSTSAVTQSGATDPRPGLTDWRGLEPPAPRLVVVPATWLYIPVNLSPSSSVNRTASSWSTGLSYPHLSPLNSLFLCRIEPDGDLTETQRLPLSSHPGDYGAEILVNTAGDRLYASSRGSGVLLVYRISGDRLEREENMFNMAGSWPRHFALQDNILVTTDQRGAAAQIVHIDGRGLLLPGKTFAVEEQPAFVTFI